MKKLDNFSNCLTILANADFKMAETNDIYRTGVIGQFNLTFTEGKGSGGAHDGSQSGSRHGA